MSRQLAIASILALALGGCATYDSGYRHRYADANDRGAYNDGYYEATEYGYADYSYGRPQFAWDRYSGYGYPCSGFGYNFGYFPGRDGFGFGSQFGYDPWICNTWYGYGYPYGWYRPWPRHRHHDHDNDHDADDPPGGWTGSNHVGGVQVQAVTAPGDRPGVHIHQPVRQPGLDGRNQRVPIRRTPTLDAPRARDGDSIRNERREQSVDRPHQHDGAHR